MRLGVFASHPIQYQVPLWRSLARAPNLEVVVHYLSDRSVRGAIDQGFGVPVSWDVPLLEGYEHVFVGRDAHLRSRWRARLPNARALMEKFDWVLIGGYTHAFERQLVRQARSLGVRVALRAELRDACQRHRTCVVRLFRRAYLRWFYARVDAILVIGGAARRHLGGMGVHPAKMWPSPYSVDTEMIEEQRKRFEGMDCRQELGLAPRQTVFLFSGKLAPVKAPLLMADAVKRLRCSELALIVLGDGPLRAAVEAALRPLLGARLVMPGFVNQSQLGRYFLAADALLLPSESETWGLVVNEAMQFGLPVLVSDAVGCHEDLVEEGRTGFVFPRGDSEALADRMARVMASRELATAMGRNARRKMVDFTVEAATRGILAAIGAATGATPEAAVEQTGPDRTHVAV